MKHSVIFFLTLLLCMSCAPSLPEGVETAEHGVNVNAGSIASYEVYSPQMDKYVSVDIWMPEGYTRCLNHYPVIYMQDGQGAFDKDLTWNNQAWNIDSVITALGDSIEQPIVVAVYCDGETRMMDYMPGNYEMEGANGDAYLAFLVHTLKPFVDKQFRTKADREHTLIMGSSMGALISVYAIQAFPEVFKTAMGLSYPAVMEFWHLQYQSWKTCMPEPNTYRLYLDNGTGSIDSTFFPQFYNIEPILRGSGVDENNYLIAVYAGEDHCEDAWERRLHIPLRFALGKARYEVPKPVNPSPYGDIEEHIVAIRKLEQKAMQEIRDSLVKVLPADFVVSEVISGLNLDDYGVENRNDYRDYVWLNIYHNGEEYTLSANFRDQDHETGNMHSQVGRIQFWGGINRYSERWCSTPNTPVGDEAQHWIFNYEKGYDPKIKLYDPDYSAEKVVNAFLEWLHD